MTDIANLQDHMAYSCKCGCVDFNLLKSGNIECVSCGGKITDSEWGLMPEINQKPVAWRWGVPKLKQGTFEWRYSLNKTRPDSIPLYAAPPQRKPLTDEEIYLCTNRIDRNVRGWANEFARAIEAAHGIKENT